MSFNLRVVLAVYAVSVLWFGSGAVAQEAGAKDARSKSKTANADKARKAKSFKVGKIVKEAAGTPVWTDPRKAADEFEGFEFMGEYIKGGAGLQIVPAANRFYLSAYQGGLPGAGWDGDSIAHQWLDFGELAEYVVGWQKVDRSWKLEFPAAPQEATVLFDGQKHGHWKSGEVIDGLLQAGARTKKSYTDFRLHLEFMTPLKPTLPLSHPGRGNSGVFALGAYEVQVMDTFGLDPSPDAWQETAILKKPDTWCGSIYGLHPPVVNACLPPLAWQTLDIDFTAAKFDGDKKNSDALMTVKLNGVVLHDALPVPSGTGGGPSGPRAEVSHGPILIQKHGSPVVYRNVWIVERGKFPHPP